MTSDKPSVLITGAGICGLCSGIALAKAGHRVTIIERDAALPDGDADAIFFEWIRRGASQFKHPHAFLGVMSNLLTEMFPDLIEDFWAAGARKITFEDMLPDAMVGKVTATPEDDKLWLLMCRRATMEMVLRRYAEKQSGLEIQSGVRVNRAIIDTAQSPAAIKGLEVQPIDPQSSPNRSKAPAVITADLYVDAGGRGSHFKKWIEQAGLPIQSESHDAEIVYYTRHYKLKPGVEEPPRRGKHRSAGDLGYLKYGVFPGEDGHFAVIVCVPKADGALHNAVKDNDEFDAICRAIPGLQPWVDETAAIATTDAFGMGNIKAEWHDYVNDDRPLLNNYFAVGDSAIRTNPLYGRGCSTGIIHSHLLREILAQDLDPIARAMAFHHQSRERLRPIWEASLREDRNAIKRANRILLDQEKGAFSVKRWFQASIGDAVNQAAQTYPSVFRGAMRSFNLMETPGAFLAERKTQGLVLWTLLTGGKKNKASRFVAGPSRGEMLAHLESLRGTGAAHATNREWIDAAAS